MTEDILEIESLSREFGGVHAVDNVSTTVRAGELRAVIGPNGAGKSTLFGLVSGRLTPSHGDVRFNGQSIRRLPPHKRARLGIAITYQNPPVFPGMTVQESVILGAHRLGKTGYFGSVLRVPAQRREEHELGERAAAALERLGVARLAHRHAEALSFGDRRRVQIARALAAEPTLLLLDEPASGLHRSERTDFIQLLQRLHADGLTIMLVEHDVELVMEVADRITVMHLGARLAEGSPTEVAADRAVVDAYLGAS